MAFQNKFNCFVIVSIRVLFHIILDTDNQSRNSKLPLKSYKWGSICSEKKIERKHNGVVFLDLSPMTVAIRFDSLGFCSLIWKMKRLEVMFLKFLFKFKEKSVKFYELNGLDIPGI